MPIALIVTAPLQAKLESLARSMAAAQGRPVTAEEALRAAIVPGVEALEQLVESQLSKAG
jgi:hypothetical protein